MGLQLMLACLSIGDPGCVCRSSRDRARITSVIQLLWWCGWCMKRVETFGDVSLINHHPLDSSSSQWYESSSEYVFRPMKGLCSRSVVVVDRGLWAVGTETQRVAALRNASSTGIDKMRSISQMRKERPDLGRGSERRASKQACLLA